LKSQTGVQLNKLKQMKFQDPRVDKKQLVEIFANLVDEITTVFKNLMNKWCKGKYNNLMFSIFNFGMFN